MDPPPAAADAAPNIQRPAAQDVPAAEQIAPHPPPDMALQRPAVDADRIIERRAAEHVLAAENIAADHPPRLADAELRRQVDDIGFLEARHSTQEVERFKRLAPPLDLPACQIV